MFSWLNSHRQLTSCNTCNIRSCLFNLPPWCYLASPPLIASSTDALWSTWRAFSAASAGRENLGSFEIKWVSLTGYPKKNRFSSSPFSPSTCYYWGYIAVYHVFRHTHAGALSNLWKWSESFVKYGGVSNGWISEPASFVYSFVFTWFWAMGVQATLKLFGGIQRSRWKTIVP